MIKPLTCDPISWHVWATQGSVKMEDCWQYLHAIWKQKQPPLPKVKSFNWSSYKNTSPWNTVQGSEDQQFCSQQLNGRSGKLPRLQFSLKYSAVAQRYADTADVFTSKSPSQDMFIHRLSTHFPRRCSISPVTSGDGRGDCGSSSSLHFTSEQVNSSGSRSVQRDSSGPTCRRVYTLLEGKYRHFLTHRRRQGSYSSAEGTCR